VSVRFREEQLRLPFDQYQRYRMVADAVVLLRGDAGPLRILDVGGGEEGIIRIFLPEDRITILDRGDPGKVPGFVTGDVTALPFEDGAFDYVASVDVYEHIEPGPRERYLSELRRVARRGVLLAAPFDSDVVRAAERVANEFHRSMHLAGNVWLEEHAENGLPQLDVTREFFEGSGDMVSVLPNGYIPHWLTMICLTFYSSRLEGELGGVFERVNAFYNEFVYGLDNTEPCYRHLLVALKEPAAADLGPLVSPGPHPGRDTGGLTPLGTLSAMLPMATGLQQLNARVARREGELARKEAQVKDLSRRLAERVSVENARRAEEERRVEEERRAAGLRRDHDGLRQRIEHLEHERDELRRQLAEIASSRGWRFLTVLHRARLGVWRMLGSGRSKT
jgi:O-antigen biosynthesis protein